MSITQIPAALVADNAITLAKLAGGTDGNIISFDASGDPVAIATGSSGQALTSGGAGAAPAFAAVSVDPWTYGTEIVDSGAASNEFTSIPSSVTDVDLLIRTMSFTGTVTATVVIGDGGGYETSGYAGDSSNFEGTSINAVSSGSSAWSLRTATGASSSYDGIVRLHRHDPAKFVYTQHHFLSISAETTTHIGGTGSKTLSAVLDRIKIAGGTFDGNTTFQIRYR